LSGDTLRMTIKVALVLDLRRASADLAGGAMVLSVRSNEEPTMIFDGLGV
jgi:hypothetical protein